MIHSSEAPSFHLLYLIINFFYMRSLKCLLFFVLLIAPNFLWSQEKAYVNILYGGPSSVERVPGPAIETGLFITPQIGLGIRWETEPFNTYFHHGIGAHLRLSTQTPTGKGWYFRASFGRGFKYRRYTTRVTSSPGYLYSEFSIGRYLTPHIIFSSGVRSVSEYEDVPSRSHTTRSPGPSHLLINTFTFNLVKEPVSDSPSLEKLNRSTYYYGAYSINTRFFDELRVNGMINVGVGWKFLPNLGLGLSMVLNEGLGTWEFMNGINEDKLRGIGAHLLLKQAPFWGMVELGAANQVAVGRQTSIRTGSFIYRQHDRASTFYGRIAGGIYLNKHLIAQASFLIAPYVNGDSEFQGRAPVPGSADRFLRINDVYFSYTDLNLGIGFLID